MPVPTFDRLMRPILVLATSQAISRRSATEAMISHFSLTPEESALRIPSGNSTIIGNRCGWAMTFLTKAGLLEKTAPKTYSASVRAASFLQAHAKAITVADLRTIEGWEQAWGTGRAARKSNAKETLEQPATADETSTPDEVIGRVITAFHSDLRDRLLENILEQTPEFFEKLVLDVLHAMDYGDKRAEAVLHVGRSGDEGIDGRINQDALGLDQILVQAKRYRPDRAVDRKEVQAFVGSLAGQGVNKGVFITTSFFAASAHEFVTRGLTTKIVLVDGSRLLDLMIRHGIGVREFKSYVLKEVDQNYFDDV